MLTPVLTPADHEEARITALCRALTPQMVAAMAEIALDARAPRAVRLDACDTLLAYGRAGSAACHHLKRERRGRDAAPPGGATAAWRCRRRPAEGRLRR